MNVNPMWPDVAKLHVAKHAFGDQTGPNMQNAMSFCSPPHQGQKNCGLSQVRVRARARACRPFLGSAGVIFAVYALLALFWGLASFLAVLAAPGRLNATCRRFVKLCKKFR